MKSLLGLDEGWLLKKNPFFSLGSKFMGSEKKNRVFSGDRKLYRFGSSCASSRVDSRGAKKKTNKQASSEQGVHEFSQQF